MAEDDRQADADGRAKASAFLHMVSAPTAGEAMLFAPSAERNFAPISAVLADILPRQGRVLEVASGTGQHIAGLALAHPGLDWLPNDPDPAARASILARREALGLANLAEPTDADATRAGWYAGTPAPLAAIMAINLVHIAPFAACLGVLDAARDLLGAGGFAYLYGCFARDGRHLAPSNAAFDESLRARNPDWGVRDVGEIAEAAGSRGLVLEREVEMPANNLSLILSRRQPSVRSAAT